MRGTEPDDSLELLASSLVVFGGGYRRVAEDEYYFAGDRPGEEWVAHGSFARRVWVLDRQPPRPLGSVG